MKTNNQYVLNELKEKTNRSDDECLKINSILENHFIIGKNNKEKILKDFQDSLAISYEDADELYNICASIIMNGVKEKLKHPFKSQD